MFEKDGVIFYDRVDLQGNLIQTAEDAYNDWISGKQIDICPEPSELYLLSEQVLALEMETLELRESKEQLVATNSELSEYVLHLDERLTNIENYN